MHVVRVGSDGRRICNRIRTAAPFRFFIKTALEHKEWDQLFKTKTKKRSPFHHFKSACCTVRTGAVLESLCRPTLNTLVITVRQLCASVSGEMESRN